MYVCMYFHYIEQYTGISRSYLRYIFDYMRKNYQSPHFIPYYTNHPLLLSLIRFVHIYPSFNSKIPIRTGILPVVINNRKHIERLIYI